MPEAIRRVFVVSQDITAEEHVRMQAAIQAFVDNSISKTINFPATATVEDVKQAYMLAWKLGCKGLTVYVTGSRQEVVLETKATAEQKGKSAPESEQRPRPQTLASATAPASTPEPAFHGASAVRGPARLHGITYRKETPLGTAYITVNVNGDDQPFEVFLNVGKAGSDVAAVSEALGRLISLVLRLPSPLDPVERLKQVIDQLAGIGGGRSMGFGANRVRSLPDAVAQVLREHLNGHSTWRRWKTPAARSRTPSSWRCPSPTARSATSAPIAARRPSSRPRGAGSATRAGTASAEREFSWLGIWYLYMNNRARCPA